MSDAEAGPSEVFDLERIRALVELMKEHDLGEIDLRQADQRIRIARSEPAPAAYLPPPPMPVAPAASLPTAPAPAAAEEENPHIVLIKSPMVGTFYTRANPKAEAYVKIGDHVEPETTVCIVEAMKVFNEIPAEVRGRIVAILADDEEPVEFGKPLFKVDTSA